MGPRLVAKEHVTNGIIIMKQTTSIPFSLNMFYVDYLYSFIPEELQKVSILRFKNKIVLFVQSLKMAV